MSQLLPQDLRWLDAAVRFAGPYRGTTADNPAAAALVVDPLADVLISRAVTAPGGRPHAEPQALDEAGPLARGKTLYVTLEPCNHWGRTPPCTDAIIRAGIARVVIGTADPHTLRAGVARLRAAGIEVVIADHEPSRRLHEGHLTRQASGRPFVTLALAVSADGMIGRRGQGGHPDVGPAARDWAQLQRARADAVLIGAATAKADDPKLTVDLPGLELRTPLRVVLAGADGVDTSLNLITGFSAHRLVIMTTFADATKVPASVQVWQVEADEGRPHLPAVLAELSQKGVMHLLVEVGAQLTEAFLAAGLVDRFELLTTPHHIGEGGVRATTDTSIVERLERGGMLAVSMRQLGDDLLRTFERRIAI